MPFSIKTKDGITINNIPDDIDPNSDILKQRVAQIRAERSPAEPVDATAPALDEKSGGDVALGRLEALASILSGAVAEPVAGIAGIGAGLNPLGEPGSSAETVESVREALTFQPRTEAGKESLGTVAEVLEPVAEVFSDAESFLGDKAFEFTGSPALSAAAATIPTALAEVVGLAAGKGVIKAGARLKETKLIKGIGEAAPTPDQLKDVSRSVFKEMDDLGVTMTPRAYKGLVNKLNVEAKKAGLDPDITPKANKALQRFEEVIGSSPSLTEIDTLRKVAQKAAQSLEPAEAALGSQMINTVDGFLDNLGPTAFTGPEDAITGIGKRYKVARELWGRARRSELIGEAFSKAELQASGFENGIRVQFRQILNNKKKRQFFKPDEIKAMRRVVKGDKTENLAKLIGRLAPSEGSATNILGAAVGAGAGAALFGPAGAVVVPVIGLISRKMAQRMTVGNAKFADQIIRAGTDARKITQAYNQNTPKALRDPAELSELLMRPNIDLSGLPSDNFTRQATDIALERRATLAGGALAPGDEE